MIFVSPAEALAYVDRVDADVWRLSRALNASAPPLDPYALAWKRWRTEWLAFATAARASGATFTAPAVMAETEAREKQLASWYAGARERGWIDASAPAPAGLAGGGISPEGLAAAALGVGVLALVVGVVWWRL